MSQWARVTAGFYVDVGAHHPWRFSNTAIYYLRGGRGINIDPTPGVMEMFQKLRPNDINLELAISQNEGERTFYVYNDGALNGIDCVRSKELAGTKIKLMTTMPVKTVTLAKVLEQHVQSLPSPNFLTVDAEGHDLEVLQSNDWGKHKFEWVLCEIQTANNLKLDSNPVFKYLTGLGYSLRAFTGRTGIFSKR